LRFFPGQRYPVEPHLADLLFAVRLPADRFAAARGASRGTLPFPARGRPAGNVTSITFSALNPFYCSRIQWP
jgi:hypothetical protein